MDASPPPDVPARRAHPAYETVRAVTSFASVVLQDNPGVMTLEGTNTWVLRAPGAPRSVVVDPGETDEVHLLRVLRAAGDVELVLLTHHHHDHSQGAPAFAERTGAPLRALDPARCAIDGRALADGEVLSAGGLLVRVLATPGHTADSTSFVLAEPDGGELAVLTGDTVLGRGTTVVAAPDGDLASYLASLGTLAALGGIPVLPGHGPELPSAGEAARGYLAHREQRLQQVRDALAVLGADAPARAVVEHVYADVDEALWPAVEYSVRAQLAYLRERG